jgi:hypothetical protein
LRLLHSTAARTGKERVNPMMYQAVGDSFADYEAKTDRVIPVVMLDRR